MKVSLSNDRGHRCPRETGTVQAKMLREVSAAIDAVQGGVKRVGVFRAVDRDRCYCYNNKK